ncbi:MAG: hypothetical protein H6811_11960 [Phycisphaeraceae bacterium]|nr:hypothetical protein [Phycisphaeraceae bacterium]
MVSIAIIATLISLLLPMLFGARQTARGFKCQMGLRSVAFDFTVFADDVLHGDRGDDERNFDDRHFRLETFQESIYQIDEFWKWHTAQTVTLPEAGFDPLRCPEVHGDVQLRRGVPCSGGAVSPPQNMSYGFNIRLHVAEVEDARGRPRAVSVVLEPDVLDHAMVPLVWDIDGQAAQVRGVTPAFSGPSLDSRAVFARDRYWFPGKRHNRGLNVAFIDGHVEATAQPLDQPGWDWGFQPVR